MLAVLLSKKFEHSFGINFDFANGIICLRLIILSGGIYSSERVRGDTSTLFGSGKKSTGYFLRRLASESYR